MAAEEPVKRSFGATPRVFPRPEYPGAFMVISSQAKAMFLESGFWGTVLVYTGFRFWKAGVEYLQFHGYDEAKCFAVLGATFHLITYLACNIPFGLCDYNEWLANFKLYRNEVLWPSRKLIIQTLVGAAVNHFIAFPGLIYLAYPYFIALGAQSVSAPLPSMTEIYLSMIYGHVFNDIFFYTTHRLFHTKALYFLHKQHHSFGGTMGIAAEHANPLESLIANVFPTLGGVVFFGCKHPWVALAWVLVRVQQTCFAHSGYCFEGTIMEYVGFAHAHEVIFHDHHHTRNQGNFGCLFLDWLCGTCDHFVSAGLYDGYKRLSDEKKVKGKTTGKKKI